MERIITYNDLPRSDGESVYLRMETDPKLYISLLSKGYKVAKSIVDTDEDTIYVTGRRQDYDCKSFQEYKARIDKRIQDSFASKKIYKPYTVKFSYDDLINYKYNLPFVLKNENQNGGREKFLIATEQDYESLIKACNFLLDKKMMFWARAGVEDIKYKINYGEYLDINFTVQEYISTPTNYNTTVRILTSSSNDLMYASLKYKKPESYIDDTTLLGYLLSGVYPLSTKSIVSNTLSGGNNILIGEPRYSSFEESLLNSHSIDSKQFNELVKTSQWIHEKYKSELGIICGFDYIYDASKKQWFLLEYHSRPMVGDYSRRQSICYETSENKLTAEGRVRATALALTLKKNKK